MKDQAPVTLAELFGDDPLPSQPPDPLANEPAWNGLTAGELSDSEAAALARSVADSPRGQWAYAASQPLSAAARQRFVEAIANQLAAPQPPASVPEPSASSHVRARTDATSSDEDDDDESAAPQSTKSTRLRARLRPALWLAPLLAAAAVMLFVGLGGVPLPHSSPLPNYAIDQAEAGSRTLRSPPSPGSSTPLRVRLGRGETLKLVLRPATPVTGPVAARAYLLRAAELRPWPVPIERAASGAFRIVVEVDKQLALEAGHWRLALVVARPDAWPSEAQLITASAGNHNDDWQLLIQSLLVEPAEEQGVKRGSP